jgi:hypothetical protein
VGRAVRACSLDYLGPEVADECLSRGETSDRFREGIIVRGSAEKSRFSRISEIQHIPSLPFGQDDRSDSRLRCDLPFRERRERRVSGCDAKLLSECFGLRAHQPNGMVTRLRAAGERRTTSWESIY